MKLPALGKDATNDMRILLRGELYPVVLEESVETRYCPLPPNQVPTTASAILSRGPAKGLLSCVTKCIESLLNYCTLDSWPTPNCTTANHLTNASCHYV